MSGPLGVEVGVQLGTPTIMIQNNTDSAPQVEPPQEAE